MILAEHTADCNPVVADNPIAAADTRNNPVERAADNTGSDHTAACHCQHMNSCHHPVERAADTRRKPARNPERMILAEHTADCNPVVAAADTRNNPVERAAVRDLLV